MKINQQQSTRPIFINLHLYIWLLLLALHFIQMPVICQLSTAVNLHKTISENEKYKNELNKSESFFLPNYSGKNSTKLNLNKSNAILNENNGLCQYIKSDNRLICTGSLDVNFLRSFQHKEINDLVIEKYEIDSYFNIKKYWDGISIETGKWYINLPKRFLKLTAEINLKDTGVNIIVITSLEPISKTGDLYFAYGITFSNSVVKFSNNLMSKLRLDFENNRTVIYISAQTVEQEAPLSVSFTLKFIKRNIFSGVDEWQAQGTVQSNFIENNDMGFFIGTMKTLLLREECKFMGEVEWESSKLKGSIYGKVSSPKNKQVTIPSGVFANMTVKKLAFIDSNFLNDFEKDTFKGLKGVQTIEFINSELEMMPPLSEFFCPLSGLREIYIEGCTTPNMKFGTLSSLKNIRKISFKNSGPIKLEEFSFDWLKNSNLTHLSLAGSHIIISSKAYSVLEVLSDSLKFINVSYSTIRDEKELTILLTSLKILSLSAESLQLTEIPTTSLAQVKDTLQYLSLRGNHFKKVFQKNMFSNILQFPRMEKLIQLNLENCNINYIEKGAFDNLPNLKYLNMKFNQLENLQEGWVFTTPLIAHLDLSYNEPYQTSPYRINNEKETKLNLSIFKNLEVLNLSNGIFMDVKKVIASLENNLRKLYMRNVNLQNLPLNIFQKLTKLETLDLSYNKDLLFPFFSIDLFQNLKNLKNLTLSNCRINNDWIRFLKSHNSIDSNLFQLDNLTYLDLSRNDIRTLDFLSSNKFPKLKILNLSANNIIMWKTSLFESVKYLETLILDENKIENMTDEMIADIWQLKNVKLGNNPFVCKPFVYEILKMTNKSILTHEGKGEEQLLMNSNMNKSLTLISRFNRFRNQNKIVNFMDWSDSAYVCFSCNQSKYVPFVWVNETCEEQTIFLKNIVKEVVVLWLPMIIFVGIVVSVVLICKKLLGVHFISKAIKHAVALTFLNMGEKEPVEYNYNIFLSYCDEDRQWVIDNLLPRLETINNIKVCLHERDFQVGLSILENIVTCMDSSKNIILILSQSFLKSHWCQYEMHLAQHRLLENGRDQLLLIFLENIPAFKKSKTLRYLMMTKTYLEWPAHSKNPNDYEIFWNRLQKSLSMKFDEQ